MADFAMLLHSQKETACGQAVSFWVRTDKKEPRDAASAGGPSGWDIGKLPGLS